MSQKLGSALLGWWWSGLLSQWERVCHSESGLWWSWVWPPLPLLIFPSSSPRLSLPCLCPSCSAFPSGCYNRKSLPRCERLELGLRTLSNCQKYSLVLYKFQSLGDSVAVAQKWTKNSLDFPALITETPERDSVDCSSSPVNVPSGTQSGTRGWLSCLGCHLISTAGAWGSPIRFDWEALNISIRMRWRLGFFFLLRVTVSPGSGKWKWTFRWRMPKSHQFFIYNRLLPTPRNQKSYFPECLLLLILWLACPRPNGLGFLLFR